MKNQLWLLIGVLLGLGCTGENASNAEQASTDVLRVGSQEIRLLRSDAPVELVEEQFKLSTPRGMSNGITQLSTMRDRPEVVALLEDAWRSDKDGRPDFNWAVLDTPTAKLAIAAVLGQWANDKTPYRTFVQGYLDNSDPMTRVDAVIALGTIGDTADIQTLADYANSTDEVIAISALGTLHSSGTTEARAIVESVANNPSMPESRRNEAARMLAKSPPPRTTN